MQNRHLGKMALFQEALSGKKFICCTLTVLHSIYIYNRSIGRSVNSLYMRPQRYIYLGSYIWTSHHTMHFTHTNIIISVMLSQKACNLDTQVIVHLHVRMYVIYI